VSRITNPRFFSAHSFKHTLHRTFTHSYNPLGCCNHSEMMFLQQVADKNFKVEQARCAQGICYSLRHRGRPAIHKYKGIVSQKTNSTYCMLASTPVCTQQLQSR
jgi:hypothetical protein